MQRLENFLSNPKGVRFIFGSFSWEQIQWIRDILRHNPDITAQTFANYDGDWMRHPAVTMAMARKVVAEYRGLNLLTPNQATADQKTIVRLTEIFTKTPGAYELLFGKAPELARKQAQAALVEDSDITAATFKGSDNPWLNRVLDQYIVAENYAADMRPTTPHAYPGQSLKNLISWRMGLKPDIPLEALAALKLSPQELRDGLTALADGKELSALPPALAKLFSDTAFFPQNKEVDAIAKSLRDLGGENPVVTSCKVVVFSELGPITAPLFFVQKTGSDPKAPSWACVDNGNRHYEERNTAIDPDKLTENINAGGRVIRTIGFSPIIHQTALGNSNCLAACST